MDIVFMFSSTSTSYTLKSFPPEIVEIETADRHPNFFCWAFLKSQFVSAIFFFSFVHFPGNRCSLSLASCLPATVRFRLPPIWSTSYYQHLEWPAVFRGARRNLCLLYCHQVGDRILARWLTLLTECYKSFFLDLLAFGWKDTWTREIASDRR